jgi:hypothetical protein
MSVKTWGIIGAVVVLAAAGTATALLVSGGGTSDYKTLPKCDKLSAAVPGKPALQVGMNVTDATDVHGLHPAYTNIQCETADKKTSVEVDLYEKSNMDLLTMHAYQDKQVHDGAWRAKDIFDQSGANAGFRTLKPGIAYGTLGFDNSTCWVRQVKGNAVVLLTAPMAPTHSLDQWWAACESIAQTQMPEVVDAAL